jgi:hypothetical protein
MVVGIDHVAADRRAEQENKLVAISSPIRARLLRTIARNAARFSHYHGNNGCDPDIQAVRGIESVNNAPRVIGTAGVGHLLAAHRRQKRQKRIATKQSMRSRRMILYTKKDRI